jgi:hypothetical protein
MYTSKFSANVGGQSCGAPHRMKPVGRPPRNWSQRVNCLVFKPERRRGHSGWSAVAHGAFDWVAGLRHGNRQNVCHCLLSRSARARQRIGRAFISASAVTRGS